MSPRRLGLRAAFVLLLAVAFLPFGVPRRLAGDDAPDLPRLCRQHGGAMSPDRPRLCTVRYGRRVYVMDAITRAGFDEDTARYQRRGCEEARREGRQSFVYHPLTGVCERRP